MVMESSPTRECECGVARGRSSSEGEGEPLGGAAGHQRIEQLQRVRLVGHIAAGPEGEVTLAAPRHEPALRAHRLRHLKMHTYINFKVEMSLLKTKN